MIAKIDKLITIYSKVLKKYLKSKDLLEILQK